MVEITSFDYQESKKKDILQVFIFEYECALN